MLDEEDIKNLINHTFELWWNPEFERRRAAGTLSPSFRMSAGQVLFPQQGREIIRFNEEVRGLAEMDAPRDLKVGDLVRSTDVRGLKRFDLLEEDLDHGHLTMILLNGSWLVTFNFLRRRYYCGGLVTKAKQFISAAQFSFDRGENAPSVENLFAACELAVKATVILSMLPGASSKSHAMLHRSINAWAKLGNVNPSFVALFNRVSQLRAKARYEAGEAKGMDISAADIATAAAELEELGHRCDQRLGKDLPDVA